MIQKKESIAEVPCRHCDGEGRSPSETDKESLKVIKFGDYPCPVCNGRGILRLKFPDTPTNCGPCRGTGRTKYGKCSHCRGYGMLSLTGSVIKLS